LYSLLGEVISEKDRCSTCRGKKVVNETKILDVHIDKGMREGQKIYFRGEGDQQVNMMELENGNILHFISPHWFQFTDKPNNVQITVVQGMPAHSVSLHWIITRYSFMQFQHVCH
jgi:DnaJ-class molecular chaperone with C-terminal Zn finger domain